MYIDQPNPLSLKKMSSTLLALLFAFCGHKPSIVFKHYASIDDTNPRHPPPLLPTYAISTIVPSTFDLAILVKKEPLPPPKICLMKLIHEWQDRYIFL